MTSGNLNEGLNPETPQISYERLEEPILEVLRKIKTNNTWQKFVEYWNKLSPNDRELLYKNGEPKTIKSLVSQFPILPGIFTPGKFDNEYFKLLPVGVRNNIAQMIRLLIQVNLLPAPDGMTAEQLSVDIISDDAHIKKVIKATKILVAIFATEAIPEYNAAMAGMEKALDIKTSIAHRATYAIQDAAA